jgi:hypothetical protein
MKFLLQMLAILASLIDAQSALAQSACSARNTTGDQRCSITCPPGQVARCIDGTGTSAPTCRCETQQ